MVRKGLGLLVIGFAAFYLLSQPENAAEAIQGAAKGVGSGFESIITFFSTLFA